MTKQGIVAASVAVMASMGATAGWGQAADSAADKVRHAQLCSAPTADMEHTYYLANAGQTNDGNEIQTAIRNLLPPEVKIYYVPAQNAVLVCAAPEQQALAGKLIHELDRPKKSYRISYTFTELENGKRVGTQHFALIVSNGQRTTVKQGSKVPVATGTYSATGQTAIQTQFQYLDVGMNFDATFTETAGGGQLKTKVEQSSVAEERSNLAGVQEPVVRQTAFEGSPVVAFGRPAMLSSLDLPNSLRHVDVEVMVEEVK
ncbi:MAG: hypothetical protein NVSMB62_26430 [Acidobacteriaceae bacterium]